MKKLINLQLGKNLFVFVLMFVVTMCVTGDLAFAEDPVNPTPSAPPGVAGNAKALIAEVLGWVLWIIPSAWLATMIGYGGYYFINKDDPGVINEIKKGAKISTIILAIVESISGIAAVVFSRLGI